MAGNSTDDVREFALSVVRRLRLAGFEALWAGGCVRDILRNEVPKDYDVATSARPDDVQRLFRRTVPVGIAFGVVRVLGPRGHEVEVATFRTDVQYSDGRRPDAVRFSSAEEDAQRRDFTINGIFLDPIENQIKDFVGGQEDIKHHVLRAIGDPNERFNEDKLRLLRAVRFIARFNLRIDPATERAIYRWGPSLPTVSAERIQMELRAMLTAPTRAHALTLLASMRLLEYSLPGLPDTARMTADPTEWEFTLRVMGHWRRDISFPLAIAGLFAARDEAAALAATDQAFLSLKGSNDERQRATWLVAHRRDFDAGANTRLALLKRRFGHPGCDELLDYHEALAAAATGGHPATDDCRALRARLTPEEIDPPPILTGDDLIAAGYKPGPRFKGWLEQIRDEQLDGNLKTREEALTRIAALAPGRIATHPAGGTP